MQKYSIKNIKSFKNTASVEIKPITIFVGKNSCGKSSLIRFPVVIAQSMNSDADIPVMFLGKNLDYGNYEDVVFGHNRKELIEFSVEYKCLPEMYFFRLSRNNKYFKKYKKELNVSFEISVKKYSRRMIVDKCKIKIDNIECISIVRGEKENYDLKIRDIEKTSSELAFSLKHLEFVKFIPCFTLDSVCDSILNSFCEVKCLSDVEKQKMFDVSRKIIEHVYFQDEDDNDDMSAMEEEFGNTIQLIQFYSIILMASRAQAIQDAKSTYYIGPFRENPQRVYRDAERQVDSVGARGEEVSTMLKGDFSHGKKVVLGVSDWFEKAMNYKLTLKDIGSGLYNIVVEKEDGTRDNLIDVGYGISQVLPVVAQLVKMRNHDKGAEYVRYKKESTFIIEQPELHLHPGAQAELANLFVDTVLQCDKSNKINVLIETHSEHFIRRLQALIADKRTDIKNDDVRIYYVDKNESGEAFITEMKILPNGQFETEWPSGFFDKAYELSMELLRNNCN